MTKLRVEAMTINPLSEDEYEGMTLEVWKDHLQHYTNEMKKEQEIFEILKQRDDYDKLQYSERRIQYLEKLLDKCQFAIDQLQ